MIREKVYNKKKNPDRFIIQYSGTYRNMSIFREQ